MTLYEKIKEYVTSGGYSPLRPEEFYTAFAEDGKATEITDAICRLLDDGVITYISKGRIASVENAGYLRGTFRANAKGFGFFMPDEEFRRRTGGDLYIAAENTMDAVNDDIVLCVMTAQAGTGGHNTGEGRIIKIVERQLKTVIGTLRSLPAVRKSDKTRYFIKPDDRKIAFTVDVAVDSPADLHGAHPGDKVEAEIKVYPTRTRGASGVIINAFGDTESIDANIRAIIRENALQTEFEDAVLSEAERVSSIPLSAEGRTDMRGKVIMTIDSAEARDLDDAISIERTGNGGYTLGVHIADVSEYVRPASALDASAFDRGTSVYFPDRVIPMLPECISNGCCSLNAGEDKYTLSAMVEIDDRGEILGCNICEAIIRTTVRGVYAEVNDILEKGENSEFCEKYKPAGELFPLMSELYALLDEKSRRRGALEIETVDSKIIIDEEGDPVDIVREDRGISERMIEQFMLAANEAVATWMFWQDMPCVYRIHEDPDPEKIEAFARFAHNMGLNAAALSAKKLHSTALAGVLEQAKEKGVSDTVNYMLLRSLMKARYSSVCVPHFGLAIEKYCHFTSPIRRYPDLSVHRILKDFLRGRTSPEHISALEAFADRSAAHSSDAENHAVSAERAVDDLYRTVFMNDKIGEVYEGVISSVTSFGLFVELENTCEGLVPISDLDGYFEYDERSMTLSCGYTTYTLGQKVHVEIVECDIIGRRIEMSLVPEDEY